MEDVISFISMLVALASIAFSISTYYLCSKREKKQATLEAYNKLQSEALDTLNLYTRKNIAEIAENPRSPEYKELSSLLARCEHFSVGVNEGIYDKKVLKKLSGRYFISLFEKLEPMILKKRSMGHQERYYESFELLAKAFEKRLLKQTAKNRSL